MFQIGETTIPAQLSVINGHIKEIFGKYSSLFINTRPHEILFEGVSMCVDVTGFAKIICQVMKAQHLQNIKEMDDGSLRFSYFNHVIKAVLFFLFYSNMFEARLICSFDKRFDILRVNPVELLLFFSKKNYIFRLCFYD